MQEHSHDKKSHLATLQILQATEYSLLTANLQNKHRLSSYSKSCSCVTVTPPALNSCCNTCVSASFHDFTEKTRQRALTASRQQLQQLQIQQQANLTANRRAEQTKQEFVDHLEDTQPEAESILRAAQEMLRCVTVAARG